MMKEEICEVIAKNMPFSFETIWLMYQKFGSFDSVIAGCKYSARSGIGSLELSIILAMSANNEVVNG